jgi:hypothetical protein
MDSLDETSTPGITATEDDGDDGAEPWIHQGIEILMRRWKNERYAPEILPFDQQTVEDLSEASEFVNENLHEER